MEKFNQKALENLGYYVYKLIDPRNGKVFYIGKGKGNRVYDHVQGANLELDKEENINLKLLTINEIKNEGLEVIHIIHRYGLTEKEAFEVEAALIDEYTGLTNIQSGHNSDYGPLNTEQINKKYSLEEIEEFDEEDKVLIIKIRRTSLEEHDNNYYETCRKSWVINKSRVDSVKQVVAVLDGVVKAVYKVNGPWIQDTENERRYLFEGEEIVDSKYKNKLIPAKYREKGKANPIQYTF